MGRTNIDLFDFNFGKDNFCSYIGEHVKYHNVWRLSGTIRAQYKDPWNLVLLIQLECKIGAVCALILNYLVFILRKIPLEMPLWSDLYEYHSRRLWLEHGTLHCPLTASCPNAKFYPRAMSLLVRFGALQNVHVPQDMESGFLGSVACNASKHGYLLHDVQHLWRLAVETRTVTTCVPCVVSRTRQKRCILFAAR